MAVKPSLAFISGHHDHIWSFRIYYSALTVICAGLIASSRRPQVHSQGPGGPRGLAGAP